LLVASIEITPPLVLSTDTSSLQWQWGHA